jgi:hypothetical protein
MTGHAENQDVLRVAYPRVCNTQQIGQNHATSHATTAQHTGLKALALLALSRNKPRNTCGEDAPKTAQQTGVLDGSFVAHDPAVLRTHLLNTAAVEYADPDLIHRLPQVDLDICTGLPDNVLRAYVRALEDEAERMAGRVPRRETAAILCVRCGPVWAPPEVAAALPVVKGMPRALGCPWCHVRHAGKYIPRPRVTCGTCAHYQPDSVNPGAGAGHCDQHPGNSHRMHYPMQCHACGDWRPIT